ncbi:MAG: diacylglycerol kinase family protein [Phycisphaerales bacterium]
MRLAIVVNPRSGKGKAIFAGDALKAAAESQGLRTFLVHASTNRELAEALVEADRVVIIGGDGTIHRLLPALGDARRPVYHYPMGTENLFARSWNCRANIDAALHAILHATPVDMDLLEIHAPPHPPSLAAIMVSLGPDASVVHRVDRARTGPISHATYIKPILAELASFRLDPLNILTEAKPVVESRSGLAVIANLHEYAMRLDPAPNADATDGLADLAFLPCRSRSMALAWLIRARFRSTSNAIRTKAREFHVTAQHAVPVQADGEPLPLQPQLDLRIVVRPAALRVLPGYRPATSTTP